MGSPWLAFWIMSRISGAIIDQGDEDAEDRRHDADGAVNGRARSGFGAAAGPSR